MEEDIVIGVNVEVVNQMGNLGKFFDAIGVGVGAGAGAGRECMWLRA